MIVQFHKPDAVVTIDTQTVTDAELEGLGISREALEENTADYDRAQELLGNSPDVITQPEMWELMRIFGRLLLP